MYQFLNSEGPLNKGFNVLYLYLCSWSIGSGKGGAMRLQPYLISECSIGFNFCNRNIAWSVN